MTEQPYISLNDGAEIPQIGLGVWQASDGDETYDAVLAAIKTGYRLIDTAMVYQNESAVGRAVKDSGVARKDLFITTKLWNSDQGHERVRPAIENSLERLGLNYVDLYLIHWPTPARDLYVETWKEFEKLKSEGLAKSIGVSNFRIEDLERLKNETGTIPVVNQIELHPRFQQRELREYCQKEGIAVESWSPIGGSKGNLLSDETLSSIASRYDKSPAQIVIRWHLQHGLIVIPKSVHEHRINENFDVFGFELSADDMALIDTIDSGSRAGPDPATMNNH
jgi:2,5-diketo-D-gluconate reductase A